VQGILGHSRIQTTLDLYADGDFDEMISAQDKFIDAVGFEKETVQWQCGWNCGLDFGAPFLPTFWKELAGTTGLEPAASAVTGQQWDVTDWYQTVSADVVWYAREP
jgi:hypothetical protein